MIHVTDLLAKLLSLSGGETPLKTAALKAWQQKRQKCLEPSLVYSYLQSDFQGIMLV
jgi:hypothetical protein